MKIHTIWEMKLFVVFVVLLGAILPHGDARKVCILYEQRVVSSATTVNESGSVSTSESISSAQDDIEITLGTGSSVQDDIVITLGDISESTDEISAVTATAFNVAEAFPLASNVTESTDICALEGITLFDDQNDILRKACTITSSSSSLYIITVQNSVVKSDVSLATLCSEGARGLLSWISWQDFIEKVRPFLDANELPHLVVRNSSIGGPSETGDKVDPFSDVLIEMLPIRYKLVNLRRSAWTNSTFVKTVSLGDIEIENPEGEEKHFEGQLSYSFSIDTNFTFLSSYPINGLSVELTDESDRRKDFTVGSGTSYLYTTAFSIERLVPAFKKETVSLKGTLGLNEYDVEGRIISVFGKNTDGSTIEESHLISARVVSSETYNIKDTYNLNDYTTTTTEDNKTTTESTEELPIAIPHLTGPLYPGFKKFFYVAVFLVLATVSIALFDVVRTLKKEKKNRQGKRSYQKIVPRY